MEEPLVSIIVPSYNSEQYISDTLTSVQNQTYQKWECIVIDDGSNDLSKEIISSFLKDDLRIKYHYQQNSGLSAARNKGMSLAKGEFIQFLDSDDVIYKNKIEKMVFEYQHLEDENAILYCDYEFTANDDPYKVNKSIKKYNGHLSKKCIHIKSLYKGWDLTFIIPLHAFLFPAKEIISKKFDSSLKSKEDFDFHLSLLASSDACYKSIEYLGCGYRTSNNSMSTDVTRMTLYALIVLYKWKPDSLTFLMKGSIHLLQFYIQKIKGKKGSINTVYIGYKKISKTPFIDFFLMILLLPISFLKKTVIKLF